MKAVVLERDAYEPGLLWLASTGMSQPVAVATHGVPYEPVQYLLSVYAALLGEAA